MAISKKKSRLTYESSIKKRYKTASTEGEGVAEDIISSTQAFCDEHAFKTAINLSPKVLANGFLP